MGGKLFLIAILGVPWLLTLGCLVAYLMGEKGAINGVVGAGFAAVIITGGILWADFTE